MWPRFGIKIGNSSFSVSCVKQNGDVRMINTMNDIMSPVLHLWTSNCEENPAVEDIQPKLRNILLNLSPFDVNGFMTALKRSEWEYDESTHMFRLKYTNVASNRRSDFSGYDMLVQMFHERMTCADRYCKIDYANPVVVLSMPYYYPPGLCNSVAQAAEDAGLHVSQLISEPYAGLLAYGLDRAGLSGIPKYILAIKSGGFSCHFVVYAVLEGCYKLLDTHGPYPIGGRNCTEAVVQYISNKIERQFHLDPRQYPALKQEIYKSANNCKHQLSAMSSSSIVVVSAADRLHFMTEMSRGCFEGIIQPVIDRLLDTLHRCLDRTGEKYPEVESLVESIVLLGGNLRIPKFKQAITASFPNSRMYSSLAADNVAAMGCAREAKSLRDPLGLAIDCVEVGDGLHSRQTNTSEQSAIN